MSKTKLPAVMELPSSEKSRQETVNKQISHIMLGSDKCCKEKQSKVRPDKRTKYRYSGCNGYKGDFS